jgi:DNA-binding MarR family transcriptional regulator
MSRGATTNAKSTTEARRHGVTRRKTSRIKSSQKQQPNQEHGEKPEAQQKIRWQEFLAVAQQIEKYIREIREALRRPLEAEFARGQLTGPQRSVMQALFHSDGMSLKELCRSVGLAHSTVSGIVDRLERRGMLVREANQEDQRFTRIVVSKAVRDFMRRKAPMITAHPLAEALARAKPSQRKAILNGLKELRRLMQLEPNQT